ncbi:hypothetical protein CPSG_00419 [Coccidioides posadasii str. Silveira]|uniref:Uncharacterized protein n=1 Tax=Coccidioides posadasii (strain RMSCC 757 / Silveira) TaxID=443226 RepID=E9CRZ7_COCPS|nr:hypothetical protein CPSG_00419 [Coccidioides posadasii str. Silveira]
MRSWESTLWADSPEYWGLAPKLLLAMKPRRSLGVWVWVHIPEQRGAHPNPNLPVISSRLVRLDLSAYRGEYPGETYRT